MTRTFLAALLALALLGCPADDTDTDGDGLLDTEEEDLGTDPELADSDGDGLDDGAEVDDHGTDPLATDSDGDGYPDGAEVEHETDPTDDEDGIYEGGWPWNTGKDDWDAPDLDDTADEGDRVGHLVGFDQFGDEVDIYDFGNQGVPIILDVSAQWCPPCQAVAGWLAWESDPYDLEDTYADLRAVVNEGLIRWVTVMEQNNQGGAPSQETAEQWDDDYPNENIPVLADSEPDQVLIHLEQMGYPSFHALDDQMVIEYRNQNTEATLDFHAWDVALEMAGL